MLRTRSVCWLSPSGLAPADPRACRPRRHPGPGQWEKGAGCSQQLQLVWVCGDHVQHGPPLPRVTTGILLGCSLPSPRLPEASSLLHSLPAPAYTSPHPQPPSSLRPCSALAALVVCPLLHVCHLPCLGDGQAGHHEDRSVRVWVLGSHCAEAPPLLPCVASVHSSEPGLVPGAALVPVVWASAGLCLGRGAPRVLVPQPSPKKGCGWDLGGAGAPSLAHI